jgi:CubicO group peptidase (beta-lactamase class C family)
MKSSMKSARILLSVLSLSALSSSATAAVFPGATWETASPAESKLDPQKLERARDYALTGGGSGMIIHRGKVVMAWGDLKQRYDLKSTTKSFGTAALGLAIKDQKLQLDDKARQHHPALGLPPESNETTGWLPDITILHLASQTAGFEKPGGYTKLLFPPGTKWDYSDSGPNWLAECITLQYRQDLDELMFERVFTPIGIKRPDLVWRKNQYRPHTIEDIPRREFGAGIHANVDAMARFGYLWLRGGEWNGEEILPRAFVRMAPRPVPAVTRLAVVNAREYGNASHHYGLLWWNNADGSLEKVPKDAYWSWGLYDSLIVVIPSLDLVVARAGKSWQRQKDPVHYEVLKPFFEPIAAALEPVRP